MRAVNENAATLNSRAAVFNFIEGINRFYCTHLTENPKFFGFIMKLKPIDFDVRYHTEALSPSTLELQKNANLFSFPYVPSSNMLPAGMALNLSESLPFVSPDQP